VNLETRPVKPIVWLAVFLTLLMGASGTAPAQEPRPSAQDRCPVCGMFIAKYPDWVASITFQDGAVVFFDGVKDLLTFYFNISHYQPHRSIDSIREIHVTDYYTGRSITAREAFFVIGSDVFGPMGKELVPFESQEAALEFSRDHNGIRVMRFEELRPTLLERLR
jgi:copper chaperone NosL